jgi:trimeric autotransporter adhesin
VNSRTFIAMLRVFLACVAAGLLVACDKEAKLESIEVTAVSASLAAGTTTQLSATGIYSDSSHKDLTGEVTWSSANIAIATVSSSGVVTALAPGTASLSATLKDVTASTSFVVTPALLVSLQVTPASSTVALGLSAQLVATGVFSDHTTQNLTTQVVWTSSSPAVAAFTTPGQAGRVRAVAVGSTNISAAISGVTGGMTMVVTAAELTTIQVTPSLPSLAKGVSRQFTATGILSDNTTLDLTSQVSWSSSNTAVASMGSVPGTIGSLLAVATGTSTVAATLGVVTGSTVVTVTPAILASIEITPPNPAIANGLRQQFAATGIYTDGTPQDITAVVTWGSSASAVATVSNAAGSNGLASSTGLGTATITATMGTVSASTTLTVTPATLVSIGVTPATSSIAKGLAQQFTATGVYTDNSTQNLTTTVTWSSADTAVATISNAAGSQGLATSANTGPTTITATLGTVSGGTQLTVTPATLVSIEVTPATPSIAKGLTQQLTATGIYTDSTAQNLTTAVTWTSSVTSVATISNAAASQGLATSAATGITTIAATLGTLSGSTQLMVTPAIVVSIGVTPAAPSVAKGLTQQFTATGTYTDNTTQNLTTTVTWNSSVTSIATISNAAGSQGLASTVNLGSTTITATLGSVSGATTLSVTGPLLVSIQVTPAGFVLVSGLTRQFTATGVYTDNSTQDLTTAATWSSSAPSIAAISNAAGSRGVASAAAAGATTITATFDGVAGNTQLTVTNVALTSITIAPASVSVPKGRPQQFTATGTYNDGSLQSLTTSVVWSSSVTAVAAISNAAGSNGLASTPSLGTTTITATSGSVSASTILTVIAAELTAITVAPNPASVPKGLSLQFTATGTYTDGNRDVTGMATWSSSATAIATISTAAGSKGFATSANLGSTTITAVIGSVSGARQLTVTDAILVGISVTPGGPGSYPNGTPLQFTATGLLSDGNSQALTDSADWTSSDPNIATVETRTDATPGRAVIRALGSTIDEVASKFYDATTNPNVYATVTASYNGFSASGIVRVYLSYNSGTAGIFNQMGACSSCHNQPPLSTTVRWWYSADPASTWSALYNRTRLNNALTTDFYYYICGAGRGTNMASTWSVAQCGAAKEWRRLSYPYN